MHCIKAKNFIRSYCAAILINFFKSWTLFERWLAKHSSVATQNWIYKRNEGFLWQMNNACLDSVR